MKRLERAEYVPTPREIAAECAAIRGGWSPAERRRRRMTFDRLLADARQMFPQLFSTPRLAPVRVSSQAS